MGTGYNLLRNCYFGCHFALNRHGTELKLLLIYLAVPTGVPRFNNINELGSTNCLSVGSSTPKGLFRILTNRLRLRLCLD